MKKKIADNLIKKTIADYNTIADEFSSKRSYLAPDIKELKKLIKNGDNILDFGCGNGILNDLFVDLDISYIGVDNSKELLNLAIKKYPNRKFELINNIPLKFEDEYFDIVFCLAMLHHIPSNQLRKDYFQEIKRVMKKGGIAIITAWQPKNELLSKVKNENLEERDYFIPFKNSEGRSLADRYIHVFTENELIMLAKDCGFEVVKSRYFKRGNRGHNNLFLIIKFAEKLRPVNFI